MDEDTPRGPRAARPTGMPFSPRPAPLVGRDWKVAVIGHSDLARNLPAAMNAYGDMNGFIAGVFASIAIVAAVVSFALWLAFDLRPTWLWSQSLAPALQAQLPVSTASLIPVLVLAITLFPTAIQFLAPRLMQADVLAIRLLFWSTIAFDAITDIPYVTNAYASLAPASASGIWYAASTVVWALLVALATIGLQQLFVLSLAVAVVLTRNATSGVIRPYVIE